VSRPTAARAFRSLTRTLAPFIAVAVIAAIVVLPFGLLAARAAGLSAYVVQGAPTGSMLPIGALVVVAPPDAMPAGEIAGATPSRLDTAWVAIPTLGYAVTYAEVYSEPIITGLIIWILFVFAVRALAPYTSASRRRLPA
jgi:hypothetical protein